MTTLRQVDPTMEPGTMSEWRDADGTYHALWQADTVGTTGYVKTWPDTDGVYHDAAWWVSDDHA